MSADYEEFLAAKAPSDPPSGMQDLPPLPPCLKPFQAAIVSWALRRGRAAIFAGTGLGKTLMQLSWARAVADYENAQILILTPLAVAEQTVAEAAKFGIDSVAYAADHEHATTDIVVSNYERFEKFDIDRFAGIVLDESGIIKAQDGKTRAILTESCRDLHWRLCCTATPAPNDYTELGQHAEFLGVMSGKEMLSMYFVHDGSIRADDHSQGADGWRLKRHATESFWRWLASWAVVIRHPSDLGFDEPGYDLPPLRLHQVTVAAEYKPTGGMLFPMPASTLGDRVRVRRDTAQERIEAAVEIIHRYECSDTVLSRAWTPPTIRKNAAERPAANVMPPIPNAEQPSNNPLPNGANQTQARLTENHITKPTSINGKNDQQKSKTSATPRGEKNITQTQNIVTLTGSGQKNYTNQGSPATDDQCLSAYTGLGKKNTTQCSQSRTAGALYAGQRTGKCLSDTCALTTATKPASSEDSCASLAISGWESSRTTETCFTERLNISARPPVRWIVWCKLNKEQDALENLLKEKCFSVHGGLPPDEKILRIHGWLRGERPILLSKPKICGWGMNFQICNRVIFVGASDSFEETYQAIRRCWRFGQARPVDVYFVASELEGAVVANLRRKEIAFDEMLDAMAGHMRDLMREQVIGGRAVSDPYNPQQAMQIPDWLYGDAP